MDAVFRNADAVLVPQLKELWQLCFGDSMEYISAFFEKCFDPRRAFAAVTEGGRAAAAVYAVEFSLPCGKPGFYLYAGGTHPDYRGRGIYKGLMTWVISQARAQGMPLCLMAEEHLRPFYTDIGYTGRLWAEEITVFPGKTHETVSFSPLTAGKYAPLRKARFSGPGALLWSENALSWALEEAEITGGFSLLAEGGGFTGGVVGRKECDALILQETTLTEQELSRAAAALCDKFGASCIRALMPGRGESLQMLTLDFPEGDGWAGLTLV